MNNQTPYQTPNSEVQSSDGTQHRTAIPKVFGIIHIVFAGLGVIGSLISVVAIGSYSAIADSLSKEEAVIFNEQMKAVGGVSYLNIIINLIGIVILIVAGITLLKYKVLGRKLTNGYSIAVIIWAVASIFVNYDKQVAVMKLQMMQSGAGISESAIEAAAMGALILGAVLSMLYPIICLIFLNREKVKQALN